MQKFIIIGGMYRSGTTLTETIVGSHPDISIPPRDFHFFNFYKYGMDLQAVYQGLGKMEIWERFNEEISRKDNSASKSIHDFSRFFNDTPEEAFTGSLVSYAKAINKKIPGVKCPCYEFHYDTILKWLSGFDTKFIHLVRNPFDMIASFQNSSYYHDAIKNNPDNIEVHSRNWCRSVSLALARTQYNPNCYYTLKYENLAMNPTKETKTLCDFMGVEFNEKKMLNAEDFDYYGSNTSFGSQARSSGNGFVKAPKSRKNHLTDSQIKIIKTICGELAHAIKYEDQDFFSNLPEPLKPNKSPAKQLMRNMALRFAQSLEN
jgi:hypothetical protein